MSSATLLRPKKHRTNLQRLPVAQAMLQALTHDEEHIRLAAQRAPVGTLRGESCAVIIDGLVNLLRHRDAQVRSRAGAVLVAFGTPAIPALLLGLWKRAAARQVRLAQVLAAIATEVPASERMKLFFEADRALWQAADEAVIRARLVAQAALMREGVPPQPGQVATSPRCGGHSPAPASCVHQGGRPATDAITSPVSGRPNGCGLRGE